MLPAQQQCVATPPEMNGGEDREQGVIQSGAGAGGAPSTPLSCIFIGGKVYDVSSFMHSHPGGRLLLARLIGRDATEGFRKVGHSAMAYNQLEDLRVHDRSPGDFPQPLPKGMVLKCCPPLAS